MHTPRVAITGPDNGGGASWRFTALAVRAAGGDPLRATPSNPCSAADIDALILGGGADVNPVLYGEERYDERPPPRLWGESRGRYAMNLAVLPVTWIARKVSSVYVNSMIDASRDSMESELLNGAVNRKIPILGICRGEQLLNVFFGGTLHQGLESFYVEEPEIRTFLPRKKISIVRDTKLAAILGTGPRRVNGLHLQGVNKIGRHLRPSAFDKNGIVQAIEHESLPFVIGVQWHPEYLPQLREQRAIFKALVRTCGRRH